MSGTARENVLVLSKSGIEGCEVLGEWVLIVRRKDVYLHILLHRRVYCKLIAGSREERIGQGSLASANCFSSRQSVSWCGYILRLTM